VREREKNRKGPDERGARDGESTGPGDERRHTGSVCRQDSESGPKMIVKNPHEEKEEQGT
jgi:hypothetical protein